MVPLRGHLPVLGEGLKWLWLLPQRGIRRTHVAHPRVPSTDAGRDVWPPLKCAKFIQSKDTKIYNSGGIQGWAKAVACAQAPDAFCEGQQRLAGASRPLQVQGLRAGDLEQQDRGTGGARMGPAGGPDSLVLWHLGAAPSIPLGMPKARVAVAYRCGQALLQQRGLWGTRGPEWGPRPCPL